MSDKIKIGVFDDEDRLISSIKKLNEEGIRIHDVFTPYPIHEVLKLLKRKSRLPTAAYFYGLFAIAAVLSFLYYTSVIDWPVVYGGKPFNSFPSFIIITIVLTIFTVTIASLATFSVRSKLYPGRENPIYHEQATDDMFVIVVTLNEVGEESFKAAGTLLKKEGAVEINEKTLDDLKKD